MKGVKNNVGIVEESAQTGRAVGTGRTGGSGHPGRGCAVCGQHRDGCAGQSDLREERHGGESGENHAVRAHGSHRLHRHGH